MIIFLLFQKKVEYSTALVVRWEEEEDRVRLNVFLTFTFHEVNHFSCFDFLLISMSWVGG